MELNFTQEHIKQLLDDGKHDEVLGIFLGIENAVNECKQKTVETEQLRMEFLATISHELRTPLNAIIGYNSLLEDGIYGELNEKQTRAVQRVDRNSNRLLNLVNQLLDLSRLEAGAVAVYYEATDLTQLINEILDDYKPAADEKGLSFEVTQPHGGCKLVTDCSKVREIIRQLVCNAIKFSTDGTIKVSSKLTETGSVIEISDMGPGIPVEKRECVFELFRQVDASYTRKHEGCGLGLAIVSKLSSLLNICTEVESEAENGTLFRLHIPSAQPLSDDQQQTPENKPASSSPKKPTVLPVNQSPKSVLIVDDDPYTVELLSDILENRWNCMVQKSYSGMHAMIHLAKQKPDFLLVDLLMPQINGERVIHYCHELWGKNEVNIIVITGKSLDESELNRLQTISSTVIKKGDLKPQKMLQTLEPLFQNTAKASA